MFAGRVVLIAGGGRQGNIGYATARRVASLGATVALADLPGVVTDSLAEALPGRRAHSGHAIDVTDRHSVGTAVDQVLQRHGRIDAAMLSSGILITRPFLDTRAEDWDRTFAVNVTGVFHLAQAVARSMVSGGGGRILAVASNAARVPRMTTSAYGASKAAVLHLAHCMALELAPYGITVNTLCPGSTATSMAIDVKSEGDPSKVDALVRGSLAEWRLGIPLGRLADPDDQAAAAAFLLSDDARHITGQSLSVDGGQTFF